MTASLTGSCLCGAVSFSLAPTDLEPADACHCSQCRKWSGHYWASVSALWSALKIDGESALTWYRASDIASRGFCRHCGASLFWRPDGVDGRDHRVAVALGALDAPTGLSLSQHIYVGSKGDYYAISDGLPRLEEE